MSYSEIEKLYGVMSECLDQRRMDGSEYRVPGKEVGSFKYESVTTCKGRDCLLYVLIRTREDLHVKDKKPHDKMEGEKEEIKYICIYLIYI